MFSEPLPGVRARVVKTLSVLTKLDPNLISREIVRDSVTERFSDMATSVREEAVKLVGGFVLLGRVNEIIEGNVILLENMILY